MPSLQMSTSQTLIVSKSSLPFPFAIAIAGLCNDVAFESSGLDEPIEIRKVNGDATSVLQTLGCLVHNVYLEFQPDTGLLRFSESITPVECICESWKEMGKIAFNSSKYSETVHPYEY